jgi:predicted HAD superfamily Cof-like phosphohydrolase
MVEIVSAWFKAMNQEVGKKYVLLYDALIDEEYKELQEALSLEDKVDALVDLMWVTAGALIHTLGEEDALKAVKEVRRSNFTKIAMTESAARASVEEYKERGVEASYKRVEGGYIVYRLHDNKVLKPITFFEPDWTWLTSKH